MGLVKKQLWTFLHVILANKQAVTGATAGRPGGVVRVYSDVSTDSVTPASFVPYCSMAHAQLSFHGHKDAVKFFAAVPGIRLGRWRSTSKTDHVRGSYLLTARCCTNNVTASGMPCLSVSGAVEAKKESGGGEKSPQKNKSNLLVISGGEGYIDFRQGLTPAL